MIYEVTTEGAVRRVQVRRHPEGGWWVSVDGAAAVRYTGGRVGVAEWQLRGPEGTHDLGVFVTGDRVDVQHRGWALRAEVVDPRRVSLAPGLGGGGGIVRTPMPGVVVRIAVAVGDAVAAGDPVAVVEAMKMENELRATASGVVTAVRVGAGDAVEVDEILLEIAPQEAER